MHWMSIQYDSTTSYWCDVELIKNRLLFQYVEKRMQGNTGVGKCTLNMRTVFTDNVMHWLLIQYDFTTSQWCDVELIKTDYCSVCWTTDARESRCGEMYIKYVLIDWLLTLYITNHWICFQHSIDRRDNIVKFICGMMPRHTTAPQVTQLYLYMTNSYKGTMEILFTSLFGFTDYESLRHFDEHYQKLYWTETVGVVIYGAYMVIVVTVMMNALIAMMSNTYTKVEVQWLK